MNYLKVVKMDQWEIDGTIGPCGLEPRSLDLLLLHLPIRSYLSCNKNHE